MIWHTSGDAQILKAIMLVCAIVGLSAEAQVDRDRLLLLAQPQARDEIINSIVARRGELLPVLIELSKNPPASINRQEFDIGLAQAFGRLATPEGIPFLLKKLTLQRGLYRGLTANGRMAVVLQYPAVGALIEIGQPALHPIAERLSSSTTSEERHLAIIIIGAVGGSEARELLTTLRSNVDFERRLIDEALGPKERRE